MFAFVQETFDLIPSDFSIETTGVLGGLTTVSNETIAVALVAGVAGMLALETRASSGVGVAISVTTIPAAAYLGVSAGLREFDEALGALAVLGANVSMMVIGAVGTLELQGLLRRRALARRKHTGDLLGPAKGLQDGLMPHELVNAVPGSSRIRPSPCGRHSRGMSSVRPRDCAD